MKTNHTPILPTIVLLAIGLAAAGCPKSWDELTGKTADRADPAAAETTAPPQKYQDPDFGFSLDLPSDWEVITREQNPVLFSRPKEAGPSGPMINVVIENLNKRMAPYDYLKANLLTMQVSMPGLEVRNGGVEVHAGISMAWLQYAYPRDGVIIEALSYCQTKEFRAYVVTGLAPAREFKKLEPTFREIGRSLRVK